jgi:hypothetical protein
MLFKIANRFRKNSFTKSAETYVLYVKWGKGPHTRFGQFQTREQAIESFQNLRRSCPSHFGRQLSNDYRVKRCFQQYTEECISVPTFKELEDKLPELKGVFVD